MDQKRGCTGGAIDDEEENKKKKKGPAPASSFFSFFLSFVLLDIFSTLLTLTSLTFFFSFFLLRHIKNHSGAALIPVLFLGGLIAAVFFRQAWGALVVALFAAATAAPAGAISQRFRHARVWDCWRRYFSLRAAVPEIPYVDPGRRYIVVQTPHSVFPMG